MCTSYLIKATGEMMSVEPANKTDFTLEEVQKFCNDCVEVVFDNGDICMIASENAVSLGFKYNSIASYLATEALQYPQPILGDVLVCQSRMFK